ncbi:hypothetical protein ACX9R5_16180 [Rathayibacter sp. CAU 1779]
MVRDWLIGPLWEWPCDDLDAVVSPVGSPWEKDAQPGRLARWRLTNGPDAAPVKSALYRRHPLVEDQRMPHAAAGASFAWTSHAGSHDGELTRTHTGADGLVDWSGFARTPQYRLAVAVTQLEVDQAEWRDLEVHSTGPVAVWVNGVASAVFDDITYMEPSRHPLRVRLEAGITTVVIASWQLALRECRHVVGLRVLGQPVAVVIDQPGADEYTASDEESRLDAIAFDGSTVVDGTLAFRSAPGFPLTVRVHGISVPGTGGGTAVDEEHETVVTPDASGRAVVALPAIRAGVFDLPYEALITLSETGSRNGLSRTFPVTNASEVPTRRVVTGAPEDWRTELLGYARELDPGIASALARADEGGTIGHADLRHALGLITDRGDCSDFEAVGILLLLHRVPDLRWEPGARQAAIDALLGFKYWIDQPGLDAQCYFTENHQFVWHVAEHLAGRRFADRTFTGTGWDGVRHADHGARLAAEWLSAKLAGGFSEFESNAYAAINCFSLVALAELGDQELAASARKLLDLLLCSLATASWRGIHATAHGRSYTRMLRTARLEETGPLMWLCWGTGSLNPAAAPAVALATTRAYHVPQVVREIARASSSDWSYSTVNSGRLRPETDLLDRPFRSVVTGFHTPHAAIACVEDYRVGLPGLQEHVWGVTLGPETQVFATHPATSSRSGDVRPNAWSGHRVLPRARRHEGSVIALHRIPVDDPTGRTHLWFPSSHFDEVIVEGDWIGGRLGHGLVAVATDGGFERIARGDEAGEEWTPRGAGLWYVATIGSVDEHGSLGDFTRSLTTPEYGCDAYAEPWLRWTAPGGGLIEADYAGRFTVNGGPVAAASRRFDSPACSADDDPDAAHDADIAFSLGGASLSVTVR